MILKTTFFFSLLVCCCTSCSNMPITQVPATFIDDVTANLKEVSSLIMSNYKSNSLVRTETLNASKLKMLLGNLKVRGFEVTYKYDSIANTPYPKGYSNPSKSDSLIVIVQFKNLRYSLDSWETSYQIQYYFGSQKPAVPVYFEKKSAISKKINDSIFTYSERHPNP